MNQQLETVIKAALMLLSLVLGTETLAVFDAAFVNKLAALSAIIGAYGVDQWSTYRLKKQGIVSTTPQKNVDAPGSPQQLAAEEKKPEEKT
jgi:hypothetical protein